MPVRPLVPTTTRGPVRIDLDWDALADHPYRPEHVLRLHHDGWERRVPQALVE